MAQTKDEPLRIAEIAHGRHGGKFGITIVPGRRRPAVSPARMHATSGPTSTRSPDVTLPQW